MSANEVKGKNVPIKIWSPLNEVESGAIDQLKLVAALPWVFKHVAAMPDLHVGKGCTVGSVVAMKEAVAPAAVGVDIGCGMGAIKTDLNAHKVERKLKEIYDAIEANIPTGFNQQGESAEGKIKDDFRLTTDVKQHFEKFKDLDDKVQGPGYEKKALTQLGTLGGGNHFIELCLDTQRNVWLMLHSGSRNIGKELAEVHIARARAMAHNAELPDKDLSVFLAKTPEMAAYRRDLYWAQEYAFLNRRVMMHIYKNILKDIWPGVKFDSEVLCHHNYVSEEEHYGESVFVTRKGAIRAQQGDMGIIPGSMGTKSFIVKGLGNPESFNSASHGAGRKMSRGQAKKKFTREDLEQQTKGVMCRKDTGVLDEIPKAYKDIDRVMENQRDLVEVVAELKQILCIKG